MQETVMYQLAEVSRYMMAFVIVTQKNNVIIIDGGRPVDMEQLKQYVGGRHISAWILTHAHEDHIGGFVSEFCENGGRDFDIEKVYYNFPPLEWLDKTNVQDYEYFKTEVQEMLPAFHEVLPLFHEKTHIVTKGEAIVVDEVKIDFLYTYHEGLTSNPLNDSSLVFKLTAPNKSVLFLGDLGPEGGDELYWESRHLLKADIVQMAHHGHMNCGMEVYAAIQPEICLWCCPDWLYNEPEVPDYLADYERAKRMGRTRMYGTAVTRKWMEQLGVKTHYVTKDGTHRIVL